MGRSLTLGGPKGLRRLGGARRLGGLRRLAALVGVLALAACDRAEPPAEWTDEGPARWRPLDVRERGAGFTLIDAPRAGIGFINRVAEERRYENRISAEGAGVAVGDVDGDGRPDLFFAATEGMSALYRNLGRWRFEDVTATAGVALEGVWARGAVLADVDGDRDLDLLITVHGAANRLFLNDGAGVFSESPDGGFAAALGSGTAALADIDGDGDLDLYVANYKTVQADDLFSPAQTSLERLRPDEAGVVRLPPELEGHYRVEFDGRFVRRWELGERDELYLNDGSGRFEEAPLAGGRVLDEAGIPLAEPPRDWGLTARFHDWDLDGDPDLYVANDFTSPDQVWLNRGDGTFQAASEAAIRTTSLSSMAVDFSDVERDGDMDLVTTDMLARDAGRRLSQVPSFIPGPDPPGRFATRSQVNRNALQLARGDGTFAEAAYHAGIAASDWTWGALFVDVDLDGYEDLLVTTGHPWDQLDGDTNRRLAAAPGAVPWQRHLSVFPPLAQPNAAFRNRGDATFEDLTERWGFGPDDDISHGIASGDLDGDGDLDVVATRLDRPPALYRNDAGAARVAVRLAGEPPNTRGIGARVRLRGHPAGEQTKEVAAGGSYLSSSDPTVAFAAAAGEMELIVDWPDGRRTRLAGVRANRLYDVRQEAAQARGRGGPATAPETHFIDASAVLGHEHVETAFDDRSRQPLLPISLSRLGPGVTWLDADGDEDPELYVGSGRGGALARFHNRDGVLVADPPGLAAAYDQTTVLGSPRSRGGGPTVQDLLVGQSPYEAASPEEARGAASVLRLPLTGAAAGSPEPVLPFERDATGPLAQADVDGDGDLDLFVGGRVIPAVYPVAPSSRLLLAEGDRLVADSALSAPFEGVGLVSGAVFSDVDQDGDPDLALAIEWGPVRLFRNDGGRFTEATESSGLAPHTGRWNAVTAGDFDGDGYPDLVATGWGTNTEHSMYPPPYRLLYGDLDRDGTLDLVEAVRASGGETRPLRRRDELARGLRFIDRFMGGHTRYAASTLDEILGAAMSRAGRLEAATLRHTLFLNRRTHFEPVPLPAEAQLAPSFGVAVADLDGDGAEDLFLAQNFYAAGPGTPRYDAGRGLWLRGDGRGGLTPVPGQVSGIRVYGDARGAAVADYDRDRRVDLAVAQNGAATRLYRNVGAKPGLLVRLSAGPGNPEAIGATLRLVYDDGRGPAREIRSGGGYWSRDDAAQTLGMRGRPRALWVRWPGGRESEIELEGEPLEVHARAP